MDGFVILACLLTMEADLKRMEDIGPINGENGRGYSASIQTLENSIREKLSTLPPSSDEPCIYRVPEILRRASESAYSPQLVSIGPFHRDNGNLGKMDMHKWRYLKTYLDRYHEINLKSCLEGLRELEGRARQCYVEHISLSNDQFVEMMLLDGVFIIMFLLKFYSPETAWDKDPIINTMWMISAIQHDMILLENQLPFFVLEHLFSLAPVSNRYSNFFDLTIDFLNDLVKENTTVGTIDRFQVKHILDLLRSCCIPSSSPRSSNEPYSRHSVTELHDVGVKFKAGVSGSSCLLDVKFTSGVLEIQPLPIQDRTESFFRNLIALEQCHYPKYAYVTNYALFMDYLINTPKDAGLLIDHEIIKNYLGSHEDVSAFINNLSKDVVLYNTSYFSRYYKELDAYCKKRRHKWSTSLRRTYYDSPITIISSIAAVLLLGLTVIQTVCSILSLRKS